jgi:hypothetical protein
MTASATRLRVCTAQASQSKGSYPALKLWWQLGRTGLQRLGPQDRSGLQAAAGWETSAQEALNAGSEAHEQHCQVQAIGALLFGREG